MSVLDKLRVNRRAFMGMVTAGILAIMIGGVLLVVAYVVVNSIVTGVTTTGTLGGSAYYNSSWNSSFWNTMNNITQALGICGIGLIIVGISMIVYTLMGLSGGAGGRK